MKNLEILVSTMNKSTKNDIKKLLKEMNIRCSSLIINQCPNKKNSNLLNYKKEKCTVLSYSEKGLSKSRNSAIMNCNAKIGVIADDDVRYDDKFEEIVLSAYEKYTDADIIAFYVESKNDERPTTQQRSGKKGFVGAMKISSFQITFKKKSIIDNKIFFDEEFGAGSGKFKAGEENIFLFDCLKKGLKIYYVSQRIASVNHHESTWFNGFDKNYFETLGAAYYRMSPSLSKILIMQFLIRKHKLYKNDFSLIEALKFMHNGRKKVSFRPFFVGDFVTDTGPAIVNANIKKTIGNRGCYSNKKTKFFRVLELFFKTIRSDCVFFCSFSRLNVLGIVIANFFNKKTFYLMHGRIKKENDINNMINLNENICENKILRSVNCVFCVSKQLCDEISSLDYINKVDYVFNGIDYKNIILNYNIKKDKNLIMSTGGLMPRKNNIAICKAIKKINTNYNRKINYLIIGNDYGNLDLIKEYDFVKFLNTVSQNKCLKYMKQSYLYIQNSFYETFGLAVIESLVNDCNLLISNNVGAKDLLKTLDDADIIFDTNNIDEIASKILNILDNPNYLRLKNGLDMSETSMEHRGKELLEKIGEHLYE